MDLWDWLETITPLGNAKSDASALRKKAENSTGDYRSACHFDLYQMYTSAADKHGLLSPLYRRFAKRHLHFAIRYAQYFPDPLEIHARSVTKEGDVWTGAKEYEEVAVKRRAWIEEFKDPDSSQQLSLCFDMAIAGGLRNQLGQFKDALFWFTTANEQFHKLPLEMRLDKPDLEDTIAFGISNSLLAQFRYDDACLFLDQVTAGEMFSTYQSQIRHELRAQKELLPELVARTQDFQFPGEGLELWAELLQEVERCKSPEEAREARRKILDSIETHKSAKQINDLETSIVGLLKKYEERLAIPRPAPAQPVDLSQMTDPAWREVAQKVGQVGKVMRTALNQAADIDEMMLELNRITIAKVQECAAAIYSVPSWFEPQWRLRGITLLVVRFLFIEYLIGEFLKRLLEDQSKPLTERLHLSAHEWIITGAITLLLVFLGTTAEKIIDNQFLSSYKRSLRKLVADRVTTYWVTYNTLWNIFTGSQLEARKRAAQTTSTHLSEAGS